LKLTTSLLLNTSSIWIQDNLSEITRGLHLLATLAYHSPQLENATRIWWSSAL
jgi:hypothetical protein